MTVYDYGNDRSVEQALSMVWAGVIFLVMWACMYKLASSTFVFQAGLLSILMYALHATYHELCLIDVGHRQDFRNLLISSTAHFVFFSLYRIFQLINLVQLVSCLHLNVAVHRTAYNLMRVQTTIRIYGPGMESHTLSFCYYTNAVRTS